jgi:adenylate kinase family enzyme
MRIAITGPGGSGKTSLAAALARVAGLRHVEIDALNHGPDWTSAAPEVLRERVDAATAGDGWVTDSTYHSILGSLVPDRADLVVWLDLPVPLVMWRLVRRSRVRRRDRVELWHGNLEPGWWTQLRGLIWPSFRAAFSNRREFPRRYADHPGLRRLRSDAEVDAFVQSIQATDSTSGSSNGSERQKTPPFVET